MCFAARVNKYKIDANQELIAIGLANVAGSFVSAYPVTGSFSRTAVNSQSGVRTPAGGVFTGEFTGIAVCRHLLVPYSHVEFVLLLIHYSPSMMLV